MAPLSGPLNFPLHFGTLRLWGVGCGDNAVDRTQGLEHHLPLSYTPSPYLSLGDLPQDSVPIHRLTPKRGFWQEEGRQTLPNICPLKDQELLDL